MTLGDLVGRVAASAGEQRGEGPEPGVGEPVAVTGRQVGDVRVAIERVGKSKARLSIAAPAAVRCGGNQTTEQPARGNPSGSEATSVRSSYARPQ